MVEKEDPVVLASPAACSSPKQQENVDTAESRYAQFIARMRHQSARPLLSRIRAFLSIFPSIADQEKPDRFARFLDKLIQSAVDSTLFADIDEQSVAESLEYLITNQLSDSAILGIELQSKDREERVMSKMLLYHWIDPRHIGFDHSATGDDLEGYMRVAIEELEQLPKYRTPRDKRTLLLNAARVLCGGLGEAVSADDLLPCLITVVIRARPHSLVSTCRYIQLYGVAEQGDHDGYLFTNILAAIALIEQLDRRAVKIGDAEYEQNMEQSVLLLNEYILANEAEGQRAARPGQGADQFKVFEERAKQVIIQVKQSPIVTKSLGAFKKFLVDAEKALSERGDGEKGEMESADDNPGSKAGEDEYQLQLAMALSLSELEPTQRCNAAVETDRQQ